MRTGEKAIRFIAPLPVKERDGATGKETGETLVLFKTVFPTPGKLADRRQVAEGCRLAPICATSRRSPTSPLLSGRGSQLPCCGSSANDCFATGAVATTALTPCSFCAIALVRDKHHRAGSGGPRTSTEAARGPEAAPKAKTVADESTVARISETGQRRLEDARAATGAGPA